MNDPNEAAAKEVLEILELEPSLSENALTLALRNHPDANEEAVVAIVRRRKELPDSDQGSLSQKQLDDLFRKLGYDPDSRSA